MEKGTIPSITREDTEKISAGWPRNVMTWKSNWWIGMTKKQKPSRKKWNLAFEVERWKGNINYLAWQKIRKKKLSLFFHISFYSPDFQNTILKVPHHSWSLHQMNEGRKTNLAIICAYDLCTFTYVAESFEITWNSEYMKPWKYKNKILSRVKRSKVKPLSLSHMGLETNRPGPTMMLFNCLYLW